MSPTDRFESLLDLHYGEELEAWTLEDLDELYWIVGNAIAEKMHGEFDSYDALNAEEELDFNE